MTPESPTLDPLDSPYPLDPSAIVFVWQCNWLWIITAIIIFSHNAKAWQQQAPKIGLGRGQQCWQCSWWWWRLRRRRGFKPGAQGPGIQPIPGPCIWWIWRRDRAHNLRLTILLITRAAQKLRAAFIVQLAGINKQAGECISSRPKCVWSR